MAVDHRVLWAWTLPELLVVAGLFVAFVGSLTGHVALFSSVDRPLRVAASAFLAVELAIPAWVYLDLRRREDPRGSVWVHVAAMPGLNLFGLLAYLSHRR